MHWTRPQRQRRYKPVEKKRRKTALSNGTSVHHHRGCKVVGILHSRKPYADNASCSIILYTTVQAYKKPGFPGDLTECMYLCTWAVKECVIIFQLSHLLLQPVHVLNQVPSKASKRAPCSGQSYSLQQIHTVSMLDRILAKLGLKL